VPVLVEPAATAHTPESLAGSLRGTPGLTLLRSGCPDIPESRYSFVAARPFLTLRTLGSRCELHRPGHPTEVRYGNPWRLLEALLARYELLDEIDLPFPLGAAFGFWGYGLRRFVEPRLGTGPPDDLALPDCVVGFHDHLVVFDHGTGDTWVVATGLLPDGSRDPRHARRTADAWLRLLGKPPPRTERFPAEDIAPGTHPGPESSLSRGSFLAAVERAQRYIRAGDIYQVNLAHRLRARVPGDAWALFETLAARSPAPFSAYLDTSDFQIASLSPELFLRLSGNHAITRPIKGTRPRSSDPTRDAQLTFELQTSAKELAELVMITDLLRNDLGRVCEFGSVQVPELFRLERYAHVQHLVSTVEGRLRPAVTHLQALETCFPGGSITGAPKIRAMEIIDELEPVARGPYTGCAGYLGFNRESQFSILIRTAVVRRRHAHYHAGAGIVADSVPEAEYDETLAKARGFLEAIGHRQPSTPVPRSTSPRP
jgi:para-aminobenzoate synthetase component 1